MPSEYQYHPSVVVQALRKAWPDLARKDRDDGLVLDAVKRLADQGDADAIEAWSRVNETLLGAELLPPQEGEIGASSQVKVPAPKPVRPKALQAVPPAMKAELPEAFDTSAGTFVEYQPTAEPPPMPARWTGIPSWAPDAVRIGGQVVGNVGGAIVGGALGAPAGPAGVAAGGLTGSRVGGAAGSGVSEIVAQFLENKMLGTEYRPGVVAFETALGGVVPAGRGATALGRTAFDAATSGALATAGHAGRSLIETGELPSGEDLGVSAVAGTVLGGGLRGASEVYAAYRTGQAAARFADVQRADISGARSVGVSQTAAAKLKTDAENLAWAIREENRLANARLEAPPAGPPPRQIELTGASMDPATVELSTGPTRYGMPPGATEADVAQLPTQLPEAGGRMVVGGEPINPEQMLGVPPAPPRPLAPEEIGQTSLILSRPPIPMQAGAPPVPSTELFPRVRSTAGGRTSPLQRGSFGRIQQTAKIGGAPPRPDQPRLPEVLTPAQEPFTVPIPRPSTPEPHGTPRTYRSQGKTLTAPIKAQDPGRFTPEVRRELALMVQELETLKPERYGLSARELESLAQQGALEGPPGTTPADIIGQLRARGATKWGTSPGHSGYWDILDFAVHGSDAPRQRKTSGETILESSLAGSRARVAAAIRRALFKGKGSILSDAAAEVARRRVTQARWVQERGSLPRGARTYERADWLQPDADRLVGWRGTPQPVVEEGIRALSEPQLRRAYLRERDAFEAGDLGPGAREYYEELAEEMTRRGILRPQQGELIMEAPGAGGKLSIRQKRGEGLDQPLLPGTEGVREQEIPTPKVAEAPFTLEPPPAPKTKPGKQEGLFSRLLSDEEGSLDPEQLRKRTVQAFRAFTTRVNDPKGLRRWLDEFEDAFPGEAWIQQARQFLRVGTKESLQEAWSLAERGRQRFMRQNPQIEFTGTPASRSFAAAIAAEGRRGQIPNPSPKVQGAPQHATLGQKVEGVDVGPGGVLRMGPSAGAPEEVRAETLDREFMESVRDIVQDWIEDHPDIIQLTRPGEKGERIRISTQVADLLAQRLIPLTGEMPGVSAVEQAKLFRETISEAGRMLGMWGNFVKLNSNELFALYDAIDQGARSFGGRRISKAATAAGARRFEGRRSRPSMASDEGMIAGGLLGPPTPPEAPLEGRNLSPGAARRIAALAENLDIPQASRVALMEDLARKQVKVSIPKALIAGQYAFLTGALRTASRNAIGFAGRFSLSAIDDFHTAVIGHLMDQARGRVVPSSMFRFEGEAARKAAGRLRTRFDLTLRPETIPSALISPKRAMTAETLSEFYDLSTSLMTGRKAGDVRRMLGALDEFPAQAAHFTGLLGGEEMAKRMVTGNVFIDKGPNHPVVQNTLQIWNRSQEMPTRALTLGTHLGGELRALGVNPWEILRPGMSASDVNDALVKALGSEQAVEGLWFRVAAAAREETFSGALAKNSVPATVVRLINQFTPAQMVMRFPGMNFSKMPRWIWDHGPWSLLDILRLPFDRAPGTTGYTLTSGTKNLGGSRLFRGLNAKVQEYDLIPLLQGQIAEASDEARQAFDTYRGLIDQHAKAAATVSGIRRRLDATPPAQARPERQPIPAQDLNPFGEGRQVPSGVGTVEVTPPPAPQARQQELVSQLREAEAQAAQLLEQKQAARQAFEDGVKTVRQLYKQVDDTWDSIRNAWQISAPTWSEFAGRMMTGTTLLGASVALLNSAYGEDTEWNKLRLQTGKDGSMEEYDIRSYAPLSPYKLLADVMNDFWHNTDWQRALEQVQATRPHRGKTAAAGALPGGMVGGPLGALAGAALVAGGAESLAWQQAIWDNYSGKRTPERLYRELIEAFAGITRQAGMGQDLKDVLMSRGWRSPEDYAKGAFIMIGQFLSGYAVPISTVTSLGAGAMGEQPAIKGLPDTGFRQEPGMVLWPLLEPLKNIPGARNVLQDFTSPTTGAAVRQTRPWVTELTGAGVTVPDPIRKEAERIGLESRDFYIERTDDPEIDQLHANELLKTFIERTTDRGPENWRPGSRPEWAPGAPPMPRMTLWERFVASPGYQEAQTPKDKRELAREFLSRQKTQARNRVKAEIGLEQYQERTLSGAERAEFMRRREAIEKAQGGQPEPEIIEVEVPADDQDQDPDQELVGPPQPAF